MMTPNESHMTPAFPVTFDSARPERFDRAHVALRVIVVLVLSFVGLNLGTVAVIAYLALPAVAAVLIQRDGGEGYLLRDAPRIASVLRWLMAFCAYLALLTDRFPTDAPHQSVRFEVKTTGRPSVGSALMRLITSLPSALVLLILWIPGSIVWLIAAVFVLVHETYPPSLYAFQRGILRWQARLAAYLASLVETYPPFHFEPSRHGPLTA